MLASPVARARTAARTVEFLWARSPGATIAGGPVEEEEVRPLLTAEELLTKRGFSKEQIDLYTLGSEVYVREAHCATCHQVDGTGLGRQYPPLTPSPWVAGNETRLIELTLLGLWGDLTLDWVTYPVETDKMPPMTGFKEILDDREIAAVLTYVRNTFGNDAKPVTPEAVAKARARFDERYMYMTVEEILEAHPITATEVEENRNR